MKINCLEMANVKRVKSLRLELTANGLTVVGGRNGQGKTSVLDGIAYALGGEKFRPTNLKRDDSVGDPIIRVETDDGLVVERKGKNSELKVTDSTGRKAGQSLLDAVVSKISLNLGKFINATDAQRADMLLSILGVGEELRSLDAEERSKTDLRKSVGRDLDRKKKAVEEMPVYEDAPDAEVSLAELVRRQQDIVSRNAQNAERRRLHAQYTAELDEISRKIDELEERERFVKVQIGANCDIPADESTEDVEREIAEYEETNSKVRANADRAFKEAEAADMKEQYDALTDDIKGIRQKRVDLLAKCDLPLPELSIENGELLYRGKSWDCMSGSENLKVATAIARKMNPKCGFVLVDKLEQMDAECLKEFGEWAEKEGLQVIGTRVSTGEECTVVIEDGEIVRGSRPKNEEDDIWN